MSDATDQCVWADKPWDRQELPDLEHFELLLAVTVGNLLAIDLVSLEVAFHLRFELLWNALPCKEFVNEEFSKAFILLIGVVVSFSTLVAVKISSKVYCHSNVHRTIFIFNASLTFAFLVLLNQIVKL